MVSTVDATMRKQFHDQFKVDFERTKSVLKQTVRSEGAPRAKTMQFDIIDLTDEATERQRDGLIPVSDLDQSTVTVDLQAAYKKYKVDSFDEWRANPTLMAQMTAKTAAACNRKVDAVINAELDATTNEFSASAINFASYGVVNDYVSDLWDNDVPSDGRVWGVVTPKTYAKMMTMEQFASADYVPAGVSTEGIRTSAYREFLGVKWLMFTGLTGKGTATSKNYIYHEECIAHADTGKPMTKVAYNDDDDYNFCWARVFHAAKVTLPRGVLRAYNDDTTALT